MSEVAPIGCTSCFAALNELIDPRRYFPKQWEAAFGLAAGEKVDNLTQFDGIRMIKAVEALQDQLVKGKREAFCLLNDELRAIPAAVFATEGTTEMLTRSHVYYQGGRQLVFIDDNVGKRRGAMINFTPPGCLSCVEVLNQTIRLKGSPLDLRPDQWRSTTGDYPHYDPRFTMDIFEAARSSLVMLQTAICKGKITACYATPDGLKDVALGEAMTEDFTWALASGRINDWNGKETALFIRDHRQGEQAAPKKHIPKRAELARHYWTTFPKGHKAAGREFKQALHDLAREMGRERIADTSLKDALKTYPTPKDLPK